FKFAKLNVKTKRLMIHDEIGNRFWLNPNRKPDKQSAAKMDWSLVVWVPASWKSLHEPDRRTPENLIDPDDAKLEGPPAVIEVYTGGSIRWPNVSIPNRITGIDKRKNSLSTEWLAFNGSSYRHSSLQQIQGGHNWRQRYTDQMSTKSRHGAEDPLPVARRCAPTKHRAWWRGQSGPTDLPLTHVGWASPAIASLASIDLALPGPIERQTDRLKTALPHSSAPALPVPDGLSPTACPRQPVPDSPVPIACPPLPLRLLPRAGLTHPAMPVPNQAVPNQAPTKATERSKEPFYNLSATSA
ncbi:MAG: hypothetical protein P1U77_08155, partial [Rubripirellula sp.]|nr:hypothetical protein [Rubripirellula sp.]